MNKTNRNKYRHKILSVLLVAILILSLIPLSTFMANAEAPDTIQAKSTGQSLNYFYYGSGARTFFDKKIATVNGEEQFVYCLDSSKSFGYSSYTTYTKASNTINPAVDFILANGLWKPNGVYANTSTKSKYMTGDENKDYYITGAAVHVFDYGPDLNYNSVMCDDADMLAKFKKLVADAQAQTRRATTYSSSSISASPASQKFTLSGNYFETGWYNVAVVGDLQSYSVQFQNGKPANLEIVNASGNVVTSLTASDTKFKLRIHKNNARTDLNINIRVRGQFTSLYASSYEAPNSNNQEVGLHSPSSFDQEDTKYITGQLRVGGYVKVVKKDSATNKPLQGVTFGVYSNANTRLGSITTGIDGTAQHIGLLSYASNYYLKEESVPSGFVLDSTTKHLFNIANALEVVSVNVTNKSQKGTISMEKYDGAGNASLRGAVFEIYANKNIVVNGTTVTAKDTLVDTVTTGIDGKITTKQLELGEYRIVEKTPPAGYVIDTTPKIVTLTYGNPTAEVISLTERVPNSRQKGRIEVIKTGEVFDSVQVTESEYGDIYTPIYNEYQIENAVFEIFANEDIIINGVKLHTKDELVDTVTTGTDGSILSKDLELGEYRIVEKTPPTGFVIDKEEYIVTLAYGNVTVNVVEECQTIYNERQKAKLSLLKQLEENEIYPDEEAYQSVKFGLFARVDLLDQNGNIVIPIDSLLEISGIDEDGKSKFICDIPLGEFYVKEIETAAGYLIDGTEHDIAFQPLPQEEATVEFLINNGEPLENKVIRGSVEIIKSTNYSEEILLQGFKNETLENAVYGVYSTDNALVAEFAPTDESGYSIAESLPYGSYYVREITPPAQFELDTTKYEFAIGELDEEDILIELVHLDVANVPIIGNVKAKYERGIKEGIATGENTNTLIFVFICFLLSFILVGFTTHIKKRKVKSNSKVNKNKLLSFFICLVMVATFFMPIGVSAENAKEIEKKETKTFSDKNFSISFEEEIEENGVKYKLEKENVKYNIIKETPEVESHTLKQEVNTESIRDKAAYEDGLKDEIEINGIKYKLKNIEYTPSKISNRTEEVTAYTEYPNYTEIPSAPTTKEVSFNDSETDENKTATLSLVEVQRTTNLDWRPSNNIPITVNVYNAHMYKIGEKYALYNETKPAFTGFESEILTYANLPTSQYRITDFNWNGNSFTDTDGVIKRNALATGQQYCATYRAVYADNVSLDDIDTFVATAKYEAVTTKPSTEKITYEVEGVAKYLEIVNVKEKSMLEKLTPVIIAGILLISLIVAIILVVLAKRKKQIKGEKKI